MDCCGRAWRTARPNQMSAIIYPLRISVLVYSVCVPRHAAPCRATPRNNKPFRIDTG